MEEIQKIIENLSENALCHTTDLQILMKYIIVKKISLNKKTACNTINNI